MNKVKILRCVLIVLIAATLMFIWGNSLQPREDSLKDSEAVTNWIRPILGALIGEDNVTVHFVRKLAHFTEFAVLGAELSCLALLLTKRRLRGLLSCLAAGLLAGAIDESLQLLGDRGAQVRDVLLDFGGVLAAVLAVHLLAYLHSRRSAKN
ncbi:MAG: VanZ family protein [Oscillospiraceae bacterium]|nr:VanZ family protein [Oscillospiraceae bacterium]